MARTPTRRTPEQEKALAAAAAAAAALHQAQETYRTALIDAWDSGATKSAIAESVGVTGESVRRYLHRNGRADA